MVKEYFFANYRLLVDDIISEHELMQCLAAFKNPMPYEHTFTLHYGNPELLADKYKEARKEPAVCDTLAFEMHPSTNGWMFITKEYKENGQLRPRQVLECNKDYSEMVLFTMEVEEQKEILERKIHYFLSFKTMVRITVGAGIVFAKGLSIHASLVEKDGYGVLFVGPSGMGKSTQANLWEKYQGARTINGDSPMIYEKDGEWFAAGVPWDGKDLIYIQRNVPIKAVIVLEQAKENEINKMSVTQAMSVLLQQVMHPIWDDKAMDMVAGLAFECASKVPFYYLKNLPNEDATILTCKTINELVK